MPSVKKRQHRDDDDSEPDVQQKKVKTGKAERKAVAKTATTKTTAVSKSSDAEEPFWQASPDGNLKLHYSETCTNPSQLSKQRRVSVNKYNKSLLVNIREYYEKDGQTLPGKKVLSQSTFSLLRPSLTPRQGISLSIEQYRALIKFIPEINAQIRKEGEEIDDGSGTNLEGSDGEKALVETTKKRPSKKSNIEATSDEDED